jgi:predicted metal-binding membrane protein
MIAERAARHERAVTVTALGVVVAVALLAMFRTGDVLMMSPANFPYTAAYLVLMFVMWWTMMLAMMLPSAAPAILLFGALARKRDDRGSAASIAAFSSGYAVVWAAFSLAAVLLHIGLERFVAFDGMMEAQSLRLGGSLLVLAGIYQLTPWKQACLSRCQTPLLFFGKKWRHGISGAFRMGVEHGLYCVGCCAVLMGLLFYGGVMDLWWIGGLALYVLVEKLLARGPTLSRLSGLGLMVWGFAVLWNS